MPEDTSKLLGLIEDLAIIAEDAVNTDGVLGIMIDNNREYPVRLHLNSLDKLKKHYPGKIKVEEDHSDKFIKESMVLFDDVEVFCLIDKPKPELDINVVDPAQAVAI